MKVYRRPIGQQTVAPCQRALYSIMRLYTRSPCRLAPLPPPPTTNPVGTGAGSTVVSSGRGARGSDHTKRGPAAVVLDAASNPMETLSYVFHVHPSALRLHRELTISLAKGDAQEAADLASALAETVTRVIVAEKQKQQAAKESTSEETAPAPSSKDELPEVTPEDLASALGKVQEKVEENAVRDLFASGTQPSPSPSARSAAGATVDGAGAPRSEKFWELPEHLCITLVDTGFQLTVSEDADLLTAEGVKAMEEEKEHMQVMETYLEKEKEKWKAQRNAVLAVALAVAKRLGITPQDLHAAEASTDRPRRTESARFSPFQHCNLIIRGEAPSLTGQSDEAVKAAVEGELEQLKTLMARNNNPLTPLDERLAYYELLMSRTRMRYVVGLHKDLQLALDNSEKLNALRSERGVTGDGSSFFVGEVIRELNQTEKDVEEAVKSGEIHSVERVEQAAVISRPLLPYTFVLNCCLWFDVPAGAARN